jgi:hypothetical protein
MGINASKMTQGVYEYEVDFWRDILNGNWNKTKSSSNNCRTDSQFYRYSRWHVFFTPEGEELDSTQITSTISYIFVSIIAP